MEKPSKHAYLIMAHKNTYVLEKLIELLDYDENDIYIHVDAKCRNFNWEKYKKIVKKSKLIEVKPRINVAWGGFSQIKAELQLLKKAYYNDEYKYYHLISGADLPLKNQTEIHNFFDKNQGKVFVESRFIDQYSDPKIYQRVSVKRIFTQRANYGFLLRKAEGFCDRIYAFYQTNILKRDLVKSKGIKLSYGSQWFSVPNDVVQFLLDNEKKINYYFKKSITPDELAIQSVLNESSFTLQNNNERYIVFSQDYSNLHPLVWCSDDIEKLLKSNKLFARKFDENIDKKIVDKIVKYIN